MRNKLLAFTSSVCILAIGCVTPKQVTIQEVAGAVEVITPFSEAKYQTDKDYYRASMSYKHPDQNTAKSLSTLTARAELLAQIKADIVNFTKGFQSTYAKGDVQDVSGVVNRKFDQSAEGIVTDAIIVGTKLFKETDGRFTCYTLVEKSKKDIASQVYDKTIAEDDKLKILFDKKKFEEEYEKWKSDRKN